MKRTITIIGAGASGMMAAIAAARQGASVTVLEKNDKPLKKLLMTGNGRCNLSNLCEREDSYRGRNPERIRTILDRFPVQKTLAFFESIGVFVKDREGWVYPVNDQASSVASHLLSEASGLSVKIKTREDITDIRFEDGCFICSTGSYEYRSDAVIISTGTAAGLSENASGIAERTARKFGLEFIPYEAALVPLILSDDVVKKWGNDRLRGEVRLLDQGCGIAKKAGELQLTGYGISGIPILQISSFIRNRKAEAGDYELIADLLPGFEEEDVIARAEAARTAAGRNEGPVRFLSGLLPEKLFKATWRDDDTAEDYIGRIKHFRLHVLKKRGTEKAMVCSGGVALSSLTDDLEAAGRPGLFFTGEACDVDGDCGGFNLQWAWSSGTAAGNAAAKEKDPKGSAAE